MNDPLDTARSARLDEVARTWADAFDRLLAGLRDNGRSYVDLLEPRFGPGELGPFTDDERARMRDLSYRLLDDFPMVCGAGIIFDLDRIAATDETIQWHVRGPNGYEPYGFVYDGESSEFYDYMRLPWFAVPAREGRAAFAGPYLDFLGVDEYIVTLSTPVDVGGRFAGTTATDLEVSHVERAFLELVRGVDAHLALTNLDGRIICANSSRFLPGDRASVDASTWAVDVPTEVPMMRLIVSAG